MAVQGATFYYDLGSPYAWLAAERLDRVLGPRAVAWTPVLLGAIFRATGRSSWAQTDARSGGIAEIERRARERGLPALRWPEPWPNDGLRAMRAAVHAHGVERGPAFALAAFRVHFTQGVPLSEERGIALAAEHAGLDPAAMLAATGHQDVKDRLRALTDTALAAGVTGVPTLRVGRRLFWGDDRLEEAAAAEGQAQEGQAQEGQTP
jgi:2-hydroxychromene-2-carboxylate isomerase